MLIYVKARHDRSGLRLPVRLLERFRPERTPVGQFAHPEREVARFGAHPSLAFPASQIQEAEFPQDAPSKVTVNFMGLTGPEGVLPNPYTSLIIERLRDSDHSLRDFLDLFNHRMISLFYNSHASWSMCSSTTFPPLAIPRR